MLIAFKEEQLLKAKSSIVVTLSGIVIDSKCEHPENEQSAITITPSGMM